MRSLEQITRRLLPHHPAIAVGILEEVRRVGHALVELLDGGAALRKVGVVLEVLRATTPGSGSAPTPDLAAPSLAAPPREVRWQVRCR